MRKLMAALALWLVASPALGAGALRIGVADDPDQLDPAQSGSYVGRIVFAALCDKLVDLDAKTEFRAATGDGVGVVGG